MEALVTSSTLHSHRPNSHMLRLIRTRTYATAVKPHMKATKDLPHLHVEPTNPQELINRSKFLQKAFPDTEQVDMAQFQQPKASTWYNVKRSRAGSLPIYTEYLNNGAVRTIVRKIEGDVSQLRCDIKQALNLVKKDIYIKDTSKHIVLKGNKASVLREYLGQKF